MPFFISNGSRNRKDDSMAQAKSGDAIKVHYKGKFDDGAVFDPSMNPDLCSSQ